MGVFFFFFFFWGGMALHFYSSVDFRNTLAELYSHNGAIGVIQRLLFAFLFGCFMSTLNYTVPGLILMSRREVTSMMKKKKVLVVYRRANCSHPRCRCLSNAQRQQRKRTGKFYILQFVSSVSLQSLSRRVGLVQKAALDELK
jgi:hypothetical protein